jgi:hypothetical protein
MLTLNNRIASIAVVATSPVRVPVAASREPLVARFLTVLLRVLGAMPA